MDGGDRTIFIPIFIVDARNISASEGILKAQMIPSDKRLNSAQIQQLCSQSEIGRALMGAFIFVTIPKTYQGLEA